MNYDWETWSLFFQENWLVLLIALVVLLIVIKVVRTLVKWAIVAVIIIAVIAYSGYNLQDLSGSLDDLRSMGSQVADTVKQEALQAMAGEADKAVYTNNGDGTHTVATPTLTLEWTGGDEEVAVTYRGTSLGKWKMDATIRGLIDQARQHG
ncbi:hypothetical protein [Paenibacillus daejeonensis]|uniref:hypothetical protein n=1 Tax=Paenibacillus daejeonensis TaxID=135193 RepID=UPI00037EE46C|nr:hypothetical protein [Paenibacillus daejeonensis]